MGDSGRLDRRLGSRGWVPCQESSCHVERLMMVRFLSQDGITAGEGEKVLEIEVRGQEGDSGRLDRRLGSRGWVIKS